MMVRPFGWLAALALSACGATAFAQTTSSSGGVLPPGAARPASAPSRVQTTPPTAAPSAAAADIPRAGVADVSPDAPAEASLGVPLYPGSTYLTSFDAGRGQRYHLYGTPASFVQVVTFYRGALRSKGDVLFEQPPTHAFDVGRFRDETMAFPPGVTVKDHASGGLQGYLHVRADGTTQRFPTVVQVVAPPPAAAAPARR